MRISLLVADDEKQSHDLIDRVLAGWNGEELKVTHVYSPAEAVRAVEKESFHLVLVDLHYGPGKPEGFSLISQLRSLDPLAELIVVSSSGDFSAVQSAMRAGASDYVAKGYGRAELFHALERATERRRWRSMEKRVKQGRGAGGNNFFMISASPAAEKLKADLRRFAPKPVPVLLEGETGSGKEVAAQALHLWGTDPTGPFVAVNCAAVPITTADSYFFGHERGAFTGADSARAGVFEEADGGTLFLDEVNSLSADLQGRLLRVLQEQEVRRLGSNRTRPVSFRLVAATNQSLKDRVATGTFREDLFYRLSVLPLRVPPLRERKEDIEALANYFLPGRVLDPLLLPVFLAHSWPGNIRELKNTLLAMDALADPGEVLSISHLPEHALRSISSSMPSEEVSDHNSFALSQEEREREFLARAYRSSQGNISRLSRMLGVDRSHLHQKLVRMEIHRPKGN